MNNYIIVPNFIENTTTKARLNDDGTIKSYWITPNAGYVMHDKHYDTTILDDEGNKTDGVELGYRKDTATVGANYDFIKNENEFYTVPIVEEESEGEI